MAVAEYGCMITRQPEVHLHHIRGGSVADAGINLGVGMKGSNWLVLPLSHNFHTGDDGIHVVGVVEWEKRHGRQMDMMRAVCEALDFDALGRAREDAKQR